MAENEKLALSLECLGTKGLLFRGPKGPGDCIYTLFFRKFFMWPKNKSTWGVGGLMAGFWAPPLARGTYNNIIILVYRNTSIQES